MVVVKRSKKAKIFSSSKKKKRQITLAKKEGAMLFTAFFMLILVFINFFESKGALQASPFITKTGIGVDLKEIDKLEPELTISESPIIKQGNSSQISGVELNRQAEEFENRVEAFADRVEEFEYIAEEVENEEELEEKIEVDKVDTKDMENNPVINIEEANGRTWLSFGDTFSGDAYLDMSRTNMYIDYKTTALTFLPKYSFSLSVCDAACKNNYSFVKVSDASYISHAKENRPQGLPQELKGKEITFKTLYQLDKKKVAVFIVLENNQEKLYAYFYESGNYEAILNDNLGLKTSTRYSRLGGKLDVAGRDDDFIILYSGYEMMAFHYNQKKLTDISHFLGLRVASGGFIPKIIKQGYGRNNLWYILGIYNNGARLIKLWQNSSQSIVGSLDLSFALESELREEGLSIKGVSSGNTYGNLVFSVTSGGQDTILSFSDNGFDNSIYRQVVSQNINNKDSNVFKAIINEAILNGAPKSTLTSTCKLYLGDNLSSMQEIDIGQELSFKGESSTLYWQIICKPYENKYSSPWIGDVNDIRYQLGYK